MKVVLIRHGKTPGNLEKRYVGRTDEALSETGRKELAKKAAAGSYPVIDRLILSPMLRCRQTAEILFGREAVQTALIKEDLREMDFGQFEYKNYEELNGDPAYQEYLDAGGFRDFPDGERLKDFEKRCVLSFQEALKIIETKNMSGRTALPDKAGASEEEPWKEPVVGAVLHGGTIMAIMNRLCTQKKNYFDWMLDNGAFYLCEWDGEKLCLQDV